jgi:hypothetical protein
MKYVPHWVIDALMSKKFKCHSCKKAFLSKNLTALGIRESFSDPTKESFFIELVCRDCNKTTFFEMQEMNIVELSEDVLEEIDADLEAMEALDEMHEMDLAPDRKEISRKKKELISDLESGELYENRPSKEIQVSKITCKDVREAKKILKPKDFKHESFLEMMGMTPEEIMEYREIE